MERIVKVERITGETKIKVELDLDGTGVRNIKTGVGYLDHMLEAWTLAMGGTPVRSSTR